MATLSIDKNLSPGDKIDFELEINIFGETLSQQFSFVTPEAPPLISKVKGINVKVENKDNYFTGNNKSFAFSKYKKLENISESRYKLLIILNANKVPGDLAPDDDVLLTCAEAGFNNVPAVVLGTNNKKKNYVYLSVNKNNQPSSNIDNNTSGTIVEIKKKIKKREVTVSLPERLLNTLISEKPKSTPEKGNIEDIVIYAYKQFDGANTSSIKYKLMTNGNDVNLQTPPSKSVANDYRDKKSFKKMFTLNDKDGQKIICYVSIARYTYNGTEWVGEWLQTDKLDKTIWGKAS